MTTVLNIVENTDWSYQYCCLLVNTDIEMSDSEIQKVFNDTKSRLGPDYSVLEIVDSLPNEWSVKFMNYTTITV